MKYILCFGLVLLVSCNLFKKKYVDAPIGMMIRQNYTGENKDNVYKYSLDFPEKSIDEYKNVYVTDRFAEGGERIGRIINGKREGAWLYGNGYAHHDDIERRCLWKWQWEMANKSHE